MNFQKKSYFTLTLLVIMLAAVLYSLHWPLRASILILFLGGIGVVLFAVQLFKEVFSSPSAKEEKSGMDVSVDDKDHAAARRARVFWVWLIGLSFGIWLIGFAAATTLFAFLYSRLNGARWPLAIFTAFLCFAITYGLFELVIHAPWPQPFLWQLISG
ncbi:MAG: tripartite tricarboxylate transporter TctB family protein [Desulfobacterales bacterium]|nr:tripartite tricarboxylate transporter TctB family protein [Desulfobacterales bacterium]